MKYCIKKIREMLKKVKDIYCFYKALRTSGNSVPEIISQSTEKRAVRWFVG
jgi:hypothetical protein